MINIVDRLRLDAEPTESDMEEAAAEIERLRARVEVLEDALREIADHHPESKMTRALVRFVGLEAKP